MALKAYHKATGVEVQPGEELTDFRGEKAFFVGIFNPRKVTTKRPSDASWAQDGFISRESYNNVFDLVIEDKEDGYIWGTYAEGVTGRAAVQE